MQIDSPKTVLTIVVTNEKSRIPIFRQRLNLTAYCDKNKTKRKPLKIATTTKTLLYPG